MKKVHAAGGVQSKALENNQAANGRGREEFGSLRFRSLHIRIDHLNKFTGRWGTIQPIASHRTQ